VTGGAAIRVHSWLLGLLPLLGGCASTHETPPAALTRESLYDKGHRLYLERHYDSAAVALRAAYEMDTTFSDPLSDLAQLHFDRGMIDTSMSPDRVRDLRLSLDYYMMLERSGRQDSDTYERLCAVALALDHPATFLAYAKKNADRYPFDRQLYNLGIAYYKTGDYQSSIRVLREATRRFRDSEYIGGMYRQLGRSYMSVDRNQTAEKMFSEGLSVVDETLAGMRHAGVEKSSAATTRLAEDRIGMLLSLKGLHILYREAEKLARVEQLLRETGYSK